MVAGGLGCFHDIGDEFLVFPCERAEQSPAVASDRAGERFQRLVDAVEGSVVPDHFFISGTVER